MPTMITTGRTIPAPYLPRPAGRPGTASSVKSAKPGEKVNRKAAFHMNLASYDWRAEVMASAGQPRSLPVNSSKGVMMVQRDAIRPRSVEAQREDVGGEEVGLEALIEEGKGRREKRATTATALGFDFIANPSITALPDDVPAATAIPARVHSKTTADLEATPQTPGLLPQRVDAQEDEDEDEDEDDGWERISAYCDDDVRAPDAAELESGLYDDLIVLGELELEDPVEAAEARAEDKGTKKGRGKVSYAAALGQTA